MKITFATVFLIILFIGQSLYAQDNKVIILNLKNGYSVKGEIVEKTSEKVKIRTFDGEIFEYRVEEVENESTSKDSNLIKSANNSSKSISNIPLVVAKDDILIGLGVGLLNNLEYEKLTFPSFPITFEYVLKDDLVGNKLAIGVGGYIGYCSSKETYYDYLKNSKLLFGARSYFHYALVPNLDSYAGIFLGYRNETDSYKSSDFNEKENTGFFTANLFIGGRYFFNDRFAGTVELGWGLSIFTLGMAVKL